MAQVPASGEPLDEPAHRANVAAITDLVHTYADIVSAKEPERLRQVFSDHAVWEVPGWGGGVGHDEIVAFLAGLLDHWDVIVHGLLSGRVQIDSDHADRATGRWWITEFGVRDGQDLRIAGVYEDIYVRTDSGWRFARRRYTGVYPPG